ncbi:formamidopyrimidine-DNA glycosylase [gamma proteobacterium HTCC5015]|nr:formamidopyrimidine-DNA glycosylase [gamma proteobacterium HTCC5015]
MPELPEVETTRRGIAPHIEGQLVDSVVVRRDQLRYPVPKDFEQLMGARIHCVERRGKYLIVNTDYKHWLCHLGMSGSLRLVDGDTPYKKHDHLDIALANGRHLRYHDPRRFGLVVWAGTTPQAHPLLCKLGPEPLGHHFSGEHLYAKSRGRKGAVKNFIMDSQVVVGVGNIYASECLFLAGIHPKRAAGRVGLARYQALAQAIQTVLGDAITQGGTTLRDFVNSDGQPGYFAQQLRVYGRAQEPCPQCGSPIHTQVIGQRSSYFCKQCQR